MTEDDEEEIRKEREEMMYEEVAAYEKMMERREIDNCEIHLEEEEEERIMSLMTNDAEKEWEHVKGRKMKDSAIERFAHKSDADDMDLECPEDEFERIKLEEERFHEKRIVEEEEMYFQVRSLENEKDKDDRMLAAAAFNFEIEDRTGMC